MKFTFFAAALSAAIFLVCTHVQDIKRTPASVEDVGVIGPDGEVILFYNDGDTIIVKNCDPNTILGLTPTQARANCQGKTNKVPVESFKQAIRNLVSTDHLNVLKPITPEEIEAYIRDGVSSDEVGRMVLELDKISAFIEAYGSENANIVRKEELIRALSSSETRLSAIKKINAEVEKTVNLIADQTKLTLTKFNSDKDQFLYTVLKNFNPSSKTPCGLKGSVAERIKDCSSQLTSNNRGFVLVTRTKEFYEVHKDSKTGLLWGDRLSSNKPYSKAEKACNGSLAEVGRIGDIDWRLPSQEEFETAERSGSRKVLPNMSYWFASSTIYDRSPYLAWIYFGQDGGGFNYRFPEDFPMYISVRCVAR